MPCWREKSPCACLYLPLTHSLRAQLCAHFHNKALLACNQGLCTGSYESFLVLLLLLLLFSPRIISPSHNNNIITKLFILAFASIFRHCFA